MLKLRPEYNRWRWLKKQRENVCDCRLTRALATHYETNFSVSHTQKRRRLNEGSLKVFYILGPVPAGLRVFKKKMAKEALLAITIEVSLRRCDTRNACAYILD